MPAVKRTKAGSRATYACQQCSKVYTGTAALNAHMRADHGAPKLSCPQCDKTFTDTNNLNRHKRAAHKASNSYRCLTCNKSWKRRDNALRHLSGSKLGCQKEGVQSVGNSPEPVFADAGAMAVAASEHQQQMTGDAPAANIFDFLSVQNQEHQQQLMTGYAPATNNFDFSGIQNQGCQQWVTEDLPISDVDVYSGIQAQRQQQQQQQQQEEAEQRDFGILFMGVDHPSTLDDELRYRQEIITNEPRSDVPQSWKDALAETMKTFVMEAPPEQRHDRMNIFSRELGLVQ